MLASHSQSPFVPETPVGSHFKQSFNIFSEFGFEHVGGHLKIFAFLVISDSVEEPPRNTMTFRIVNDIGNAITVFFSEFTSSNAGVDSEDLADEETKSPADSLNFFECEGNCSFAINVGV